SYDDPADAGRKDLTSVDTTTSGYHQEALVPLSSETHAGEDVSLHAQGPGAQLAQGEIEQNSVFHIISRALGLMSNN
ncbi:alkaline phosphatase, partial [Thalassolituus alkanivorans]|uniref:alkaline phosphatase n=2 Tax=Thalassolituus alkanivorans TaxID=2881055 RepID=UPI001E54C77C